MADIKPSTSANNKRALRLDEALLGASLAGVGVGAASVAALVAALKPRTGNAKIDAHWAEMCTYRYAHRGLHNIEAGVPENSMLAFARARDAGYGIELDVHLTADAELAVIHDSDLLRLTGEQGLVEEKTIDELGEYRLCETDEVIPTLKEVLDILEPSAWDQSVPLIVEIKTSNNNVAAIMPLVMEELDAHHIRYCIESFDPRVLMWLKAERPEVIRGQLAENFMRDEESEYLPRPLRAVLSRLMANCVTRPDFIAYKFDDRALPALRLLGGPLAAKIIYWTIRTPEDMAASEKEGAPVIFEGFEPEPRCQIGERSAQPQAEALGDENEG